MTLTLELPPDLEAHLKDEAARRGIEVEDCVLQLLRSEMADQTVGAQIVAEWERAGVIGSRPDIADSQAHARMLRERAQARKRD